MAGPYSYATRAYTTLAADMAAGANSATMASAVAGTPTYKMVVTIDGDVPAKAADFEATVTGTALSSMVRLNGPDVAHSSGAQVWFGLVDDQLDYLQTLALGNQQADGWTPITGTAAYSSATSLTVSSGATSKYAVGDKIKLSQSVPLTAYWPMDSSSTDTKGGYNGTDTAVTYTAGKFGNAATFNGTTSKVVVTDNAALKPGKAVAGAPFTLAGWIKTTTAGKVIFNSWSANTNYAGMQLSINGSGKINVNTGNNTGTTLNVNYTGITGTTTATDNAWHHMVYTHQGSVGKIYLDGNLEASGYMINPAYAATNYVRIGCANDSGTDGGFYNGQIDDLFLINGYAVDQAWVQAQYAAATAQTASNVTVTPYFYVTGVADTLLTLTGGADYALYNGAITNPYYSKAQSPVGFPGYFNYVPTISGAAPMTYAINDLRKSRFSIQGKTASLEILSLGTTGGTTSVAISTTLPVTAKTSTADSFGGGCAIYDVNWLAGAWKNSNATTIVVYRYDSGNWGIGSPKVIAINLTYEIA